MSLKERLKLIRKDNNLNIDQFCAIVGVKRRTFDNIQTGETKISPQFFIKIKEVFNTNLNWLIAGTTEKENFIRDIESIKIDRENLKYDFDFYKKRIVEVMVKNCIDLPLIDTSIDRVKTLKYKIVNDKKVAYSIDINFKNKSISCVD